MITRWLNLYQQPRQLSQELAEQVRARVATSPEWKAQRDLAHQRDSWLMVLFWILVVGGAACFSVHFIVLYASGVYQIAGADGVLIYATVECLVVAVLAAGIQWSQTEYSEFLSLAAYQPRGDSAYYRWVWSISSSFAGLFAAFTALSNFGYFCSLYELSLWQRLSIAALAVLQVPVTVTVAAWVLLLFRFPAGRTWLFGLFVVFALFHVPAIAADGRYVDTTSFSYLVFCALPTGWTAAILRFVVLESQSQWFLLLIPIGLAIVSLRPTLSRLARRFEVREFVRSSDGKYLRALSVGDDAGLAEAEVEVPADETRRKIISGDFTAPRAWPGVIEQVVLWMLSARQRRTAHSLFTRAPRWTHRWLYCTAVAVLLAAASTTMSSDWQTLTLGLGMQMVGTACMVAIIPRQYSPQQPCSPLGLRPIRFQDLAGFVFTLALIQGVFYLVPFGVLLSAWSTDGWFPLRLRLVDTLSLWVWLGIAYMQVAIFRLYMMTSALNEIGYFLSIILMLGWGFLGITLLIQIPGGMAILALLTGASYWGLKRWHTRCDYQRLPA